MPECCNWFPEGHSSGDGCFVQPGDPRDCDTNRPSSSEALQPTQKCQALCGGWGYGCDSNGRCRIDVAMCQSCPVAPPTTNGDGSTTNGDGTPSPSPPPPSPSPPPPSPSPPPPSYDPSTTNGDGSTTNGDGTLSGMYLTADNARVSFGPNGECYIELRSDGKLHTNCDIERPNQ